LIKNLKIYNFDEKMNIYKFDEKMNNYNLGVLKNYYFSPNFDFFKNILTKIIQKYINFYILLKIFKLMNVYFFDTKFFLFLRTKNEGKISVASKSI
jgi:hypothetical protein